MLAATIPAMGFSQDERESIHDIKDDEEQGVRYYSRAEFERAYPLVWNAARHGLKQAQYVLGLMYLKGEHVEQDMVRGAAWMGLSTEAQVQDWRDTFVSIVNALDEAQRQEVRAKLAKYIEYYGMEAQGISCKPARSGRLQLDCTKASGTYPLYDYQ
jgi:TPR repeat protein